LQPDNLQALEQLVNLDLAEKNFPAAQRRVQTELDQKPNVDDLRLLLAKVFSTAGNFSQAEATLLKTLELSPENQGAYLVLAQLYVDAKQNAKALDKLNTVLAKNPKNIPALMLAATSKATTKIIKKRRRCMSSCCRPIPSSVRRSTIWLISIRKSGPAGPRV